MKKINHNKLIPLALLAALQFSNQNTYAINSKPIDGINCNSLLESKTTSTPTTTQWKWRYDENYFKALRSNVQHFWEWSKNNSNIYLSQNILNITGIVAGDPHVYNYGAIQSSKYDYFWAVNDFDDSGRGPFILDILYYAVRVDAQNISNLEANDILKAYQDGLEKNKYEKPEVISDLEDISDNKIDKKIDKEFDKRVTEDEKFNFEEETDLHPIRELDEKNKAFFQTHLDTFKAALPDSKEVLDIAYRIKEDGGSQGLLRFLFLLKGQKGNYHIIEFKPIVRAGVDFYQQQDSDDKRMKANFEFFWNNEQDEENYKVVKTGDQWYFMRPRIPHVFEINKESDFEDLTHSEQKEYLLYIAYKKGTDTRKQIGDKNADLFIDNIKKENAQLLKFISDYTNVAIQENKNAMNTAK